MFITKLKIATGLLAVLLAATGLGWIGSQALADNPPAQPKPGSASALSREQFNTLHKLIKPLPGQFAWREEIPWFISIQEAREKAAAEGKPLLIWVAADGQPVGSC
jgi:hypothetical protein